MYARANSILRFSIQQAIGQKAMGQSLGEYAIIVSLVGIVAVGGLLSVKDSLIGTVNGLPGASGSDVSAAYKPLTPVTPQSASSSSQTPADESNSVQASAENQAKTSDSTEGAMSIMLSNGQSLSLDSVPTDTSQLIETAGANGATMILANQLEVLADKLVASGEISEAQKNNLLALSEQGHRLADLQSAIDTLVQKSAMDSKALTNAKVTFDGKQYTFDQLHEVIGFSNNLYVTELPNPLDSRKAVGESKAFIELYDQAVASGAANNPAVASILKTLSSQISYIAENTNCVMAEVKAGETSAQKFTQQMVKNVGKSNYKAQQICTLGSGIQCAS